MRAVLRAIAAAALLLAGCFVYTPLTQVSATPTVIRGLWFAWSQCDQLAAIGPLYPDEPIDFQMTCVNIADWSVDTPHSARTNNFETQQENT